MWWIDPLGVYYVRCEHRKYRDGGHAVNPRCCRARSHRGACLMAEPTGTRRA